MQGKNLKMILRTAILGIPFSREILRRLFYLLSRKAPRNNKVVIGGSTFQSYAQVKQDVFAAGFVPKENETYLEVGSNDPLISSNTFALEKLGWDGVSIEIEPNHVEYFRSVRKNPLIQQDATSVDYQALLKGHDLPNLIGFLSIDIEPASQSYEVLNKILSAQIRFSTICFEHDSYREGKNVRNNSRQLLNEQGYTLWLGDVQCFPFKSFEDWWIDPNHTSANRFNLFERIRFKYR